MSKHYTGKEWREKMETDNPGLKLRNPPPDNIILDERGEPANGDGCIFIGFVSLCIVIFALALFHAGL